MHTQQAVQHQEHMLQYTHKDEYLAHKDVCLRFLGASIREASWGRQPSPLTPVTLQEPLERVRLACRGLSFVLGGQPMTQIEIHCGAAVLSLDTTLLWVF